METSDFMMPVVSVGDVVLWSHGGSPSEKKCPAFVTEAGDRTVQLTVYAGGYAACQVKDGVYHAGDPLRRKGHRGDAGAWEYAPQTIMLNALVETVQKQVMAIKRLEGRIENLNTKLTKVRKGQPVLDEEMELTFEGAAAG